MSDHFKQRFEFEENRREQLRALSHSRWGRSVSSLACLVRCFFHIGTVPPLYRGFAVELR